MSSRFRFHRVVLSLLVLVTTPGLAGTPTQDAGQPEQETVRLYTNVDLLEFGPPSSDPGETVAQEDLGWDFVAEFLEREDARVDADRAYDLELRRLDNEEEVVRRRRERRTLGRSPYLLYSHGYPNASRGKVRAGKAHHGPRHPTGRPAPTRGIVPLHARPTPGMAHRERVIRRAAADARRSE